MCTDPTDTSRKGSSDRPFFRFNEATCSALVPCFFQGVHWENVCRNFMAKQRLISFYLPFMTNNLHCCLLFEYVQQVHGSSWHSAENRLYPYCTSIVFVPCAHVLCVHMCTHVNIFCISRMLCCSGSHEIETLRILLQWHLFVSLIDLSLWRIVSYQLQSCICQSFNFNSLCRGN